MGTSEMSARLEVMQKTKIARQFILRMRNAKSVKKGLVLKPQKKSVILLLKTVI